MKRHYKHMRFSTVNKFMVVSSEQGGGDRTIVFVSILESPNTCNNVPLDCLASATCTFNAKKFSYMCNLITRSMNLQLKILCSSIFFFNF